MVLRSVSRGLVLSLFALLALGMGCTGGSNEPQSVEVSPSFLSLHVGDTVAIDWSVRTAGGGYRSFNATDFVFATTNSSVATVDDNGYVTAHRTGTCQVVATLRDYHVSGSGDVEVD